jgi:hypothetical protein
LKTQSPSICLFAYAYSFSEPGVGTRRIKCDHELVPSWCRPVLASF